MLTSDEISESIKFCDCYRQNSSDILKEYQEKKGLPKKSFFRGEELLNQAMNNLNPQIRQSMDCIKKILDNKNQNLAETILSTSYQVEELMLSWHPLANVGVYVPFRLVSSLITWLSAAVASKVRNLTVYLAQDPLTGEPCPASVYCAHSYGAYILVGPARFAFPCLAFGDGKGFYGSDLICGPAGKQLNILKQVSALLSNKKTDFFAGPSELAIAIDNQKYFTQALRDLSAQIEHGPDSMGYFIGINCSISQIIKDKYPTLARRILCYEVKQWDQAASILEELAIETVELLGDNKEVERVLLRLNNCGIAYNNVSSSWGDYCLIGRGCGDPTQKTARFSSGISPWLFLRLKTVVRKSYICDALVKAGCSLAEYEHLLNHFRAIQSIHDEKLDDINEFYTINNTLPSLI